VVFKRNTHRVTSGTKQVPTTRNANDTRRPTAPTLAGKSLSVAWNELSPGFNNVEIEKEACGQI
jgi:hypothetical protein